MKASTCTLLLAVCLLLSCSTPPTGDTGYLRLEGGEDWFVVWQGFEHAWSW